MATKDPPSSLEIAQSAQPRPIAEIAAEAGLAPEEIESYGRLKAKVSLDVLSRLEGRTDAPLVCVTSVTPTKSGEGKTVTSIALTEALGVVGCRPMLCLREPSLGPVFGIKGGAAGGGLAQIVPMEDVNLHFTGDLHAIGAANNLLAAMIDAHLLHGNPLGLDPLTITWRRCLDMNDRALRRIVVALGGRANGYPRETGFDITAASEVMAIVAVARDLSDLRRRLGEITVGRTHEGDRVTAEELGAAGSMAVLLKDAIKPNLVQTLEGQPVLVHAGPFANIASGNNSLIADRIALKLADLVVTESGFGADMGFEKFCDLVAPVGGIRPSAAVVVVTPKTLAANGPANLARHLSIVRSFGLEPVVAINRHTGDTRATLLEARRAVAAAGATRAEVNEGFEHGGAGATALAEAVLEALQQPSSFHHTYEPTDSLETKLMKVAALYGATDLALGPAARKTIDRLTADGLDHLPVCVAKTHLSLSHDVALGPTPENFTFVVRDLVPYTGAAWVVALAGDMQTMPGLGRTPAALRIDVTDDGQTVGLF